MTGSAGARLRDIRLQRGISLEEAHKKTKIHMDILRAIEEDSLIDFSPVYIKGFMKIYCGFLGVEPRDYVPDYKEARAKVEYVSADGSSAKTLFKDAVLRLSSFPFKGIKIKAKGVFIALTLVLALAVLFHLGKVINRRAASVPGRTVLAAAAIPQTQDNSPTGSTQGIPQSKIIRLDIYARESTFIEVKTDGRVVFRSILKKGRSESWQAANKIELSVGNASAVQLEVNGKRIKDLGRRGQPLKNILITKDALSIRR